MAAQYDNEISGLMERIQKLRDQRENIMNNQTAPMPEWALEAGNDKEPTGNEYANVEYSDEASSSGADSPDSGEFDQLSMRRHDSLFPAPAPPEPTPQKVSVFSLANFMASVPPAPVPVNAELEPEVVQQELSQNDNSATANRVSFDSSNDVIVNADSDRSEEDDDIAEDLQQITQAYNELLVQQSAEILTTEADPVNNHVEMHFNQFGDEYTVENEEEVFSIAVPDPVAELSTEDVPEEYEDFEAQFSVDDTVIQAAPVSDQATEQRGAELNLAPSTAHPVLHADVAVCEAPEAVAVHSNDDIIGNATTVITADDDDHDDDIAEEMPLPRVDVPVPTPLVEVVNKAPVAVHVINAADDTHGPHSVQADPPVAATCKESSVEGSKTRAQSPRHPTSAARRSSRSISPKKNDAPPQHGSPNGDKTQLPEPSRHVAGNHEENDFLEGTEEYNTIEAPHVRARSPPRARSQSPPKVHQQKASQQKSEQQGRRSPASSPQRRPEQPQQRPQQQSAYRISVSSELDALVQYKASLFLQTQLVDKLLQAKSALIEANSDEQRMRLQIGVDITTEMLQKSVLDSELLSCIVLGDRAAPAPSSSARPSPNQEPRRSAPNSANGKISAQKAHSAHTNKDHGVHHSAHRSLSSWQLRSASPTDSVTSADTGASAGGSNVSYQSVIGGQRTDLVRRSPSGVINSTPLTGSLKRVPVSTSNGKAVSTPLSGAGRSLTPGGTGASGPRSAPRSASSARGSGNPAGSRTLFPSSPQVSIDALRRNATQVHSLVGNIDNFCSCCRTKLVDMTSQKNHSLKHSQCRYCIHSH